MRIRPIPLAVLAVFMAVSPVLSADQRSASREDVASGLLDRLTLRPAWYEDRGDGTVSVGNGDGKAKIYYRWKGVALPKNVVASLFPGEDPFFSPEREHMQIREIEPLIHYMLDEDGLALPGYLDPSYSDNRASCFYRWEKIRFDLRQIEPEPLGWQLNPKWPKREKPLRVIDIPVPKHLLPIAAQLNQSATTALTRPTKIATNRKWISRLPSIPVRSDVRQRGETEIGYLDADRKVFYRWRGVRVPTDSFWGERDFSGGSPVFDPQEEGYLIVDFDPPVDYILDEDGCAQPGYFQRGLGMFMRWKGVRFDPSAISPERLGVLRDRKRGIYPLHSVQDIEVPAHLKAFADELNRTATTRPGKLTETIVMVADTVFGRVKGASDDAEFASSDHLLPLRIALSARLRRNAPEGTAC